MSDPITLVCEVAKVQTLADGGIRLTFDAAETAIMESAALMEMRRLGFAVKLTVEAVGMDEPKAQDNGRKIHI